MQTMYLKNETPQIDVCIKYEYGDSRRNQENTKYIQAVIVKMGDQIKTLNPYDSGKFGGSLITGIAEAINGTSKFNKIDDNLFQWISQTFWNHPDSWVPWKGNCPYF